MPKNDPSFAGAIAGYPFPPAASSIDMVTIEELFKRAFQGLATDLPKEMKRPAVTPSKTHYLSLSGATRHWPEGRSIISNDAYKATINHSDHLLLETKEEGGDMATCFRRFCFVLGHLRAAVRADGRDWAFCDRLGYLTSNIADLGTRAILTISVPLFSKEGHVQLEAIAAQHDLQASFRNRAWDLSNRTRIGLNEVDMLQRLVDGVHTILSVETMLEEGHSLDEALARA
jgi:protein-arginine kinase